MAASKSPGNGKPKPEITREAVARDLSPEEIRLAHEVANPFSGNGSNKGQSINAACERAEVETKLYFQAMKKDAFVQYVEHLQSTVFAKAVRAAFSHSLAQGVKAGDPRSMKLYADIMGFTKKRGGEDAVYEGMSEEDVENAARQYEERMGVLTDATQ
jgi:hypothetical protein